MPVFETFSKRQKRVASQGDPVLYQYENLQPKFRVQVIHIWHTALGAGGNLNRSSPRLGPFTQLWSSIHDLLAREMGVFNLGSSHDDKYHQCESFMMTADTEYALDLIEITFRAVDTIVRTGNVNIAVTEGADAAIAELNHRFREHGIGYQYVDGQIVRVDSDYLHAEVVEPALTLLHEHGFHGPEDEFLQAHVHYRAGRSKEAIVEALKAFESTMKAIFDARQWPYNPTAPAKDLIAVLFTEGLIPTYLQNQFSGLRATLEGGLPTVRNKTSGHGQGSNPVIVPEYMAAYALHLAATNIVLLVQAHKALP